MNAQTQDIESAIRNGNQFTATKAFKVNAHVGGHDGTVSSQWFTRPDDQRFTSIESLYDFVKRRSDRSTAKVIDVSRIQVEASVDDPDKLQFTSDELGSRQIDPNHWSFGQMCTLLKKVPANYLRELPAAISAINLQYALTNFRTEMAKTFVTERDNSVLELRAITGPDYGRVHDHQIVEAVINSVNNGGIQWKIPGVLDWSSGFYNPFVDVTKESTTLYASDRDIFLFMVDDTHPIEIGKLPNGDPDLLFRGFFCWNSEVGSKKCGVKCFYLRAVCQNRNLWGIEGMREMSLRHSKHAPARFFREIMPTLNQFGNSDTKRITAGVTEAKATIVATDEDSQREFLLNQKFSKTAVTDIIARVQNEEGHPPKSIWDFVQGVTSRARSLKHQDERVALETEAEKMLNKIKVN